MKFLRLLACGLLLAPCRPARSDVCSALALFDAFLAKEAASNPEYRAGLRPAGDPKGLPAGWYTGRGPILGPFTYRPRTYRELSRAQREAVLRSPRFRAFLAVRKREFFGGRRSLSIAPESMLTPGPILVALPLP
jgi:hypothetical protein